LKRVKSKNEQSFIRHCFTWHRYHNTNTARRFISSKDQTFLRTNVLESCNLHDLQVLEPKVQTFLYAETVLWSRAFRDSATTLSHSELSKLPELQRSYGLAEVARGLEQEKTSLYPDLQNDWLAEAGTDFFKIWRHL
jgi:hypothetical protein